MQELEEMDMDEKYILMRQIMENTYFQIGVLSLVVLNNKIFQYSRKNFTETKCLLDDNTFDVHFSEVDERGKIDKYKVQINYKYKDKEAARVRKLFIKKTPIVPEEIFNSMNFAALFENEMDGYTNIFYHINEFSKRKLNLPKYYDGDVQKNFSYTILEDFNSNGWQMTKERVNLTLEHALLAIKNLATFHGLGFAYKKTYPMSFEIFTSFLKETRYATPVLHPTWTQVQKSGIKRVITATRRYHKYVPTDFLDKLENLLADNYLYGKQRVKPLEPLATLCHGNYFRNNIAFKYEAGTELPIDVLMFDLQNIRYSSPMVDFSAFLALSLYAEVRDRYFDEIFQAYSEELAATYVEHTQAPLPEYLSPDSLLKEYARFQPYSTAVASTLLMTLLEPDTMSSEEMMCLERSLQEIETDVMSRGGEIVDRELAHQTKEMYDLSVKLGVDIGEGIEL